MSIAIEQAVQESLAKHYGLAGALKRLPGENINFLVTTTDEEMFVCKIVDEHMPPKVVGMECELLDHARKADFDLRLPYIHKTNTQKNETRINIPINGLYRMRMMTYVNGILLDNISDISNNLLKNVGFSLAQFDQAVAGFDHPAARRSHRWNLAEAGQHRDKLNLIVDPLQRQLASWAFDQWSGVIGPLEELPHQVIHGDANPENLLVENEQLVGIVDFGDCCYNPRVCELAIALAYLMMGREDPLAAAETVIEGYGEVLPLSSEELAVLFPLVCGRLAVTVCMATARHREDPGNSNWFSTLEPALELLGWMRNHMAGTIAEQASQ